MFIQSGYKNNAYIISNRDYTYDYSNKKSREIDMTLSGRYLANYPDISISISELDKYPMKSNAEKLEDVIKSKMKAKSEIIIGSGANGLLQNIVKILFGNVSTGNLVTPFYSFNQVEFAVTSYGKTTKRVYTDDYCVNINRILDSIDEETRAIYITNPINPTGRFIDSEEYINLAKKINIPLIIDESGIEFSKKKSILNLCDKLPENLIVVRSFSKAYGLANLRIGYIACSENFCKKYKKFITINEYSGLSCMIAEKMIIEGSEQVNSNVNIILSEREKIEERLKKIGIATVKSFSNTIFTKTFFKKSILKAFDDNNVSVVPIYDKDNNLHFRIAVQNNEINMKFMQIVEKIIKYGDYIEGVYEDFSCNDNFYTN